GGQVGGEEGGQVHGHVGEIDVEDGVGDVVGTVRIGRGGLHVVGRAGGHAAYLQRVDAGGIDQDLGIDRVELGVEDGDLRQEAVLLEPPDRREHHAARLRRLHAVVVHVGAVADAGPVGRVEVRAARACAADPGERQPRRVVGVQVVVQERGGRGGRKVVDHAEQAVDGRERTNLQAITADVEDVAAGAFDRDAVGAERLEPAEVDRQVAAER